MTMTCKHTKEPIGKYVLILCTPFKSEQMLHDIESEGGQVDQGQRGVHHVGGGFVQTIIIIIYQNMYITILFAHDLVCISSFT